MKIIECNSLEKFREIVSKMSKEGDVCLYRGTGNVNRPITDLEASAQRPLNASIDKTLSQQQQQLLDGWAGDMPNSLEAIGHYFCIAKSLLGDKWWNGDNMSSMRQMRCVQQLGFSTYLLDVSRNCEKALYFSTAGKSDADCGVYIWKVSQDEIKSDTDPDIEEAARISLCRQCDQTYSVIPRTDAVVIKVAEDELSWERAQESAYIFTPRRMTFLKGSIRKVYVASNCVPGMQPFAFVKIDGKSREKIHHAIELKDADIYPGTVSKNMTALEMEYPGVMQKLSHAIKKAIDAQVVVCEE